MAKAKKVYNFDCALCHGATGDGKSDLAKDMQLTLMDWSDPKSLAGVSDQNLIDIIRKAKGKMPPEDAARATNDEVKSLVILIRKFAKDQPASAAPATAPAAAPADTVFCTRSASVAQPIRLSERQSISPWRTSRGLESRVSSRTDTVFSP